MLPPLSDGAEHWVYLDEFAGDVIKVTKEGVYGDFYYVTANGNIGQANCTPAEYLVRMWRIECQFGFAPVPLGMTEAGQIVSRQQFMPGDPPDQEEVDQFLFAAGLLPVKQKCWVWKAPEQDGIEDWIGDARADNFVKTVNGIVPIDLRMWIVAVGHPPFMA